MTSSASPPPPPRGLQARGRAFWRSALDLYEPEPAQMELLHEAARQVDELDALRAALKASGPIVDGSKGQPVANPLYGELSRGRATLGRLMAALNFETESEEEAAPPAPLLLMSAQQAKKSRAGRSGARATAARRAAQEDAAR